MKIRGNSVGTTIEPKKVLVKSENLTEEEKAKARENIGAAAIGSGGGSVEGAVLYTPQTLTANQKAQARTNIGAVTSVNGVDPDENGNVEIEAGGGGTELSEIWAALSALQSKAYSYPVLKASTGWWDAKKGDKKNFTSVRIVDSYTPTGNETASYGADVDGTGSITVYLNGTEIIMAGNGSGKIRLNANSAGVFYSFRNVTKYTGLELLDASEVINLDRAFYNCECLKELDISSWKTPYVKTAYSMFRNGYVLESVKLPAYGFSPEETRLMFADCWSLRDVDFGRGLTALKTETDAATNLDYSKTFYKCYNLEKVTGLSAVTEIGHYAFCYTPKVITDIRPDRITNIGDSAFRLSGAEKKTDLSVVPVDAVGDKGTRHARWGADELTAIQAISGNSVFYDVPNSENQHNYDDLELWTDSNGNILSAGDTGCSTFAMYHIWQSLHRDRPYANYAEWFESEVEPFEKFKTNVFNYDTLDLIVGKLGWTSSVKYDVTSSEQKRAIIDRLSDGKPTYASMSSVNNDGGWHAIAIIGYNKDTDRLAIVDSAVAGTTGVISWIAFEDIFSQAGSFDGNKDYIWLLEYGE